MLNSKKYTSGFTLAEVLITLGIIGVVAAMTIPTILAKTQRQQSISGWKKAYASLKQAESLMKVDEGDMKTAISNSSGTIDPQSFRDGYIKHMKVVKKCDGGRNSADGCWYSLIKFANGNSWTYSDDRASKSGAILNDGTLLMFDTTWNNMMIDINGQKGPNKAGIDVFTTGIFDPIKGLVPYDPGTVTYACANESNIGDGRDCSTYYLMQ